MTSMYMSQSCVASSAVAYPRRVVVQVGITWERGIKGR